MGTGIGGPGGRVGGGWLTAEKNRRSRGRGWRRMFQKCSKNAPKVHQSAPRVSHKCTKNVSKVHQMYPKPTKNVIKCTQSVLNCPKSILKYTKSVPKYPKVHQSALCCNSNDAVSLQFLWPKIPKLT